MKHRDPIFSKVLRTNSSFNRFSIQSTLTTDEKNQRPNGSTSSLDPVDCKCEECQSYMPPTPLKKEETITGTGNDDYFSCKDDQYRVLSDVLPTFQLDSWIVNRNMNHASTSDELPGYNEISTQQALSAPTILPNEHNISSNTQTQEESSNNIESNTNEINPSDRVLNNLNHLTRVDAPLHISITLTREYPEMNKIMLKENQLREYHPGDVITGSILIESKSQKPIPFSMILVTLEGTMTIPTKGSIMRRSFLKMVDFGACYHYGYVPTTNVKTPLVPTNDSLDGSEYGFSDSMIIEPGSKHKKFFYFKLPEQLLDTVCDHQIISHFDTLPPSFGLDQSCFNGQGKDIIVNDLLGYGRCLSPGSPILLNDQSDTDQSISYSINVSIIGKDTKRESLFSSSSSLKKKEDFRYCMLQEKQHFIRFAPGEDITVPPPISDLYKHPSTSKQLEKLERLSKDTIKKLIQTKELKQIGVKDERELIELTTDAVDLADYNVIGGNTQDVKKESQLRLNTGPNKILTESTQNSSDSDIIYSEVSISLKQKKKTFSAFSSNHKLPDDLGLLTVKSSINRNSKIPYLLPSALKKIAEKPPISRADSLSDDSSNKLLPFASPSVELYPVDSMSSIISSTSNILINDSNNDLDTVLISAQPFLDKITLQLTFRPSNNEVKPPEFLTIRPILRSVTMSSPYPIPITFDIDSFISETNENGSHELNQIKAKFSSYLTNIRTLSKESGRGMDRQLFFDLLSITNLNKSEKNLSIFKTSNVTKQPIWKSYLVDGDNKLIYKSELTFALIVDKVSSKTLTILPNFDSCFFTRRYYLSVGFGLKKASTSGSLLSVPINVGQYIQSTISTENTTNTNN